MDGTGLFYKRMGSFCAGIMHCANPDPGGYRRTKDLSVTAKGGMECLAQTSDIDKAGSQSPCREVHRDTVACVHTHKHACMDAFTRAGTVSICIQNARSQGSNRQQNDRPGHWRAPKCMKTHFPSQISRAKGTEMMAGAKTLGLGALASHRQHHN